MGTRRCAAVFVVAVSCASPTRAAHVAPDTFDDVPRIVAVGDVHGAYANFVGVLSAAGLVDRGLHWTGGRTHLVQLGDVVDRGPDSRKCLDLLMRLEEEAVRAGGRVHALIGNHEAWNVLGILDYVSREEFRSYRDDSARPERVGERTNPLGYEEHRRAFGPDGRYGRWIRTHHAAVRLNGVVFSHGDWSEALAALGLTAVNDAVRGELSGTRPLEGGFVLRADGVLQHRGLTRPPPSRSAADVEAEVDRILAFLGARRLVAAHTVTSGIIELRHGGKHVSIDTGMLEIYRGGHRVALEIEGDAWRAIHPRGKVSLPRTLDERDIRGYLSSLALADPKNDGVNGVWRTLAGEVVGSGR